MTKLPLAGLMIISIMVLMIISSIGIVGQSPTGRLVSPDDKPAGDGVSSIYTIVPQSVIRAGYNMSEYEQVVSDARILVGKCAGNADLDRCVMDSLPIHWTIAGHEDTLYRFDVRSAYAIPAFDESAKKVMPSNPIYRFALDFS